jgi:hypothetical protein
LIHGLGRTSKDSNGRPPQITGVPGFSKRSGEFLGSGDPTRTCHRQGRSARIVRLASILDQGEYLGVEPRIEGNRSRGPKTGQVEDRGCGSRIHLGGGNSPQSLFDAGAICCGRQHFGQELDGVVAPLGVFGRVIAHPQQ